LVISSLSFLIYARNAWSLKANPDHSTTFCFEGHVDGQDVDTLAVDKHQLGLTGYVNVPQMLDHHITLLEGNTATAMVGPFAANEANIHNIRTRSSMFIPCELVEVLMGQDLSARDAYLIVFPLLEYADLLDTCRPLMKFLQAALAQLTNGNLRQYTLQDLLGMADYPAQSSVIIQRHELVLYRLLPALCPANLGRLPDSFAKNISDGPTNIATEMHANRRACDTHVAETSRRKTFWEHYGDRIANEIILLIGSSDNDFLPAFYQELGGKQKGES
jgi:hypothetical protein